MLLVFPLVLVYTMIGIWESEGKAVKPSKPHAKAGKGVRARKPAKPITKAGNTTHPPLFLDQFDPHLDDENG